VEEERRERAASKQAERDGIGAAPVGWGGVLLKRRGQVVRAVEAAAAATAEVGRLSIRGLKEKGKPKGPEGPYDPFGGIDFVPSRYRLGEGLAHPQVDKYRFDQGHATGGYSFEEWTARAMYEAFAGLGVFVEDEKEAGIGLSSREIATIASGIAAVGDKMELD
jgi:CDK-activating kinase assembly factor MAT1